MASKYVAYGVCPSCPADLKSGSPKVAAFDAVTGLLTLDVPQTHDLMGVGAELTINGGGTIVYVKPAYKWSDTLIGLYDAVSNGGKVSTSAWYVTDATGDVPSITVGHDVDSITHPYASLSAAEAGCTDADHLNDTDLTNVDVELHFPCYCEQSGYTADTTAVTFTGITTGANNRICAYSPVNTSTECNLSMFPTSMTWDATKYRMSVTDNTITITGTTQHVVFERLQVYRETNAAHAILWTITATGAAININRCIGRMAGLGGSHWKIAFNTTTNVGTVRNNIFFCDGQITNTLYAAIRSAGVNVNTAAVNNTVCNFYRPFTQSAGTLVVKNSALIDNVAASNGTVTHDYNVYDIDESEANGRLTSQTEAQLFAAAAGDEDTWDWSPANASDLLDRGDTLGTGYTDDFLNGPGQRPQGSAYDCGAGERFVAVPVASGGHIVGFGVGIGF